LSLKPVFPAKDIRRRLPAHQDFEFNNGTAGFLQTPKYLPLSLQTIQKK